MMRKLIVLAALVAETVLGQSNDPFTGRAWSEWSTEMRVGYAIGFSHGYVVTWAQQTSFRPPGINRSSLLYQCTRNTTFAQEVTIMDKYLVAHPNHLEKNLAVLFRDAIEQACDLRGAR
jgi:hypothetical protein